MDSAYRWRNRSKPRLLIYTDSRGLNFSSRLGKTGVGSYVLQLQASYHVTHYVCPEKYTTILDFLNTYDTMESGSYDAVLLHCGVVDFSPRPLSNIAKVRASKDGMSRFSDLFRANADYHAAPWPTLYRGEPTINLYSEEYLLSRIIPDLTRIPNLIWITSNRFVPGWDGNYVNGRPANIDGVVEGFDRVMGCHLPNVVDLRSWGYDDVKRYTLDNVHFTRDGFKHVAALVAGRIDGPASRTPMEPATVVPG